VSLGSFSIVQLKGIVWKLEKKWWGDISQRRKQISICGNEQKKKRVHRA